MFGIITQLRLGLALAFLFVLVFGGAATVQAQDNEAPIDFDRQIRPILSDRCYFCHGPDKEKRESGLRLDDREEALAVIEPGFPDDSELLRRIDSDDESELMPPPNSKITVTKEERALIRKWIEQGAPWKKHWAFQTRSKPTTPKVESENRVANGIDSFVLRKLEEHKLTYAPLASKEKLIRRVTFDLTGLPPTLTEVDAYLADVEPGAYERLVDRLLASPHYGQRMASDWLDVARYSDTYGYQVDRDRFVWPWRDWVIRAFNANKSYRDFVIEQLAGDLLDDPSDDQILATTFNRLHPQKVEGGSVEEEFRVEYVADRSQTVSAAFLGLTLECARCHDHKFDPLSQKEYYQMFSFFNNIDEAGLYSFFTNSVPTPTMPLMDDRQKQSIANLKKAVTDLEGNLPNLKHDKAELLAALNKETKPAVETVDFSKIKPGRNKLVKDDLGRPAVLLTGDDAVTLKSGNFKRHHPFSISLSIQTPDIKERAVIFHRSRAWTDAASRGYQLLIEDGKLSASLIHFWPGNAISVKTKEPVPVGKWVDVAVVYDGSSYAGGISIYVDGELAEVDIVRDHLTKNITGGGGDSIAIGERFRDRGFKGGMVSNMRVFDRYLSGFEVAALHDIELAEDFKQKVKTQELGILDGTMALEHLAVHDAGEYANYFAELQTRRERLNQALDGLQEIMVMQELPEPRPTFVLTRGEFDKADLTQAVFAETPKVLPPMNKNYPKNRLGLAKWLMEPDHPLTARVAVNHYWQLMFGEGIVRTPEDFGRQGAQPTHPELLDWLANDFVDNDWDVKRLLKKIVMSTAYRQSTVATKELRALDPDNELLARAPSFRLAAEMLRDNMLSISGLLVDKIGGAPTKPYELAASFKPSTPDTGDGLYRRSLYTYWKRTGPAPVMLALDAAKRDVCSVKRERTSSPLQALAMLNGPQFVEASRALADELIKKYPGQNQNDAIAIDVFRTLTSRKPTAEELAVIVRAYEGQVEYFQASPERTTNYLSIGKHGGFKAKSINLVKNSRKIRIGADANKQNHFSGEIERVRIVNQQLGGKGVSELFEKGRDGEDKGRKNVIFDSRDQKFAAQDMAKTSARFDGGFVEYQKSSGVFPGKQFFIEAWIKPDRPGGRIIDKITAGGGDGFLVDLHGGIRFICGNATMVGDRGPEIGKWSHIICTLDRDKSIGRMYLNGQPNGVMRFGGKPYSLGHARLAAWASVVNTLINHDECVTRR